MKKNKRGGGGTYHISYDYNPHPSLWHFCIEDRVLFSFFSSIFLLFYRFFRILWHLNEILHRFELGGSLLHNENKTKGRE